MEGLRVPRDARVNSPISSLVSAEEAEAAGAAAAASPQPPGPQAERCWRLPPTASCPISVSGCGCGWSPASRASRPRAGPYPRLTPPPPRLPAVQARPPGCTPGRGVGKRPPGRRAWGEKGAQARPEHGEQRCWLCLGSAAWAPTPPRSPLPSVRCTALGLGGGASEPSSLPGIPPPPPCLEAPNPRAWGSRSRTWGHSQGGRGLWEP